MVNRCTGLYWGFWKSDFLTERRNNNKNASIQISCKRNRDFELHNSFIFLQLFANFTCEFHVKKFFRQIYLKFIDEVAFIKTSSWKILPHLWLCTLSWGHWLILSNLKTFLHSYGSSLWDEGWKGLERQFYPWALVL